MTITTACLTSAASFAPPSTTGTALIVAALSGLGFSIALHLVRPLALWSAFAKVVSYELTAQVRRVQAATDRLYMTQRDRFRHFARRIDERRPSSEHPLFRLAVGGAC